LEHPTITAIRSPKGLSCCCSSLDKEKKEIATKFGLKIDAFKIYVIKTLSPALTGGMRLNSIDLRHYLSKQVCKEFLGLGYSPEFILSEIFHYQIFRIRPEHAGIPANKLKVEKYRVKSQLERFFRDEGLNFVEIIRKYSPNSDSILSQYQFRVNLQYTEKYK